MTKGMVLSMITREEVRRWLYYGRAGLCWLKAAGT